MNRREYLKGSAALLAAAALPGCAGDGGDESSRFFAKPSSGASIESERELFDRGEVPIGLSGWTRPRGMMPAYPVLEHDLDSDVVIVGCGLAGSSLALHLAEAGVGVVVLEARQPGWGASGRNAGHVLPMLRGPEGFETFPGGGKKFFDLFVEHHSLVFELARRHDIDCDAVQSGYLSVMTSKGAFETAEKEAAYWETRAGYAIERLGASGVSELTGSAYYDYGVLFKDGGRVNPYLFTNGLVAAAVRRGAVVYGDSTALSLEPIGNRWQVRTATGSVTADRVVFCTNAYPTPIAPEFMHGFYPMAAYALSTPPLPESLRKIVMPSGATLVQAPFELNPFIVDGEGRIVTASLPSYSRPEDAARHFRHHLYWIHRTWPETREFEIELQTYWTGRVAFRDEEYPGVFEIQPGVFGLMYFNAWGNLMAPFMGMLFAEGLAKDRVDQLPFPIGKPSFIKDQDQRDFFGRRVMLPAAWLAQRAGII